jgi:hypothetical protein
MGGREESHQADVANVEWFRDPKEGVLHKSGQNIEEWLTAFMSTRPHGHVPKAIVEKSDTTWLDTNLTKQGARWRELRPSDRTDADTTAALVAEAAQYGVVPGQTPKQMATAPAKDADKGNTGDEFSNSPFNPKKGYTSNDTRLKEIAKFIRAFGAKSSARHAAKFGVDLAGRPLRKAG